MEVDDLKFVPSSCLEWLDHPETAFDSRKSEASRSIVLFGISNPGSETRPRTVDSTGADWCEHMLAHFAVLLETKPNLRFNQAIVRRRATPATAASKSAKSSRARGRYPK